MTLAKQVDHLLVIKHGAFGDLVQAFGALQAIRLAYPEAQITLLTAPQFALLMQRCPHIDNVILDGRGPVWKVSPLWQLCQQLKACQFDLVIDLQNSSRTALYKKWVFKDIQWVGRLPPEAIPASGLKGLVALLGAHQINTTYLTKPNIAWVAEDVSQLLQKRGIGSSYIMLIPGASAAHPDKRWPYYGELALSLIDLGYEVVNVLGPDEVDLAPKLNGHVMTSLSWFQLAGVIQQAEFVIGNDTGPCHLASCLNKKGLALFGPTTSAVRSELARGDFKTFESESMQGLKVHTVLAAFLAHVGVNALS